MSLVLGLYRCLFPDGHGQKHQWNPGLILTQCQNHNGLLSAWRSSTSALSSSQMSELFTVYAGDSFWLVQVFWSCVCVVRCFSFCRGRGGADTGKSCSAAGTPIGNLHQSTDLKMECLSTSVGQFWCFIMLELTLVSSSLVVYNALIQFSLLIRGPHAALFDWRTRRT